MAIEVKLPKLADGVEKGDVLNVVVEVGDMVDVESPLIELESEKATLAVPSPAKGKVAKILVKAGETVKVGQVFMELEAEGTDDKPSEEKAAPPPTVEKTKDKKSGSKKEIKPADTPETKKQDPPSTDYELDDAQPPSRPGKLIAPPSPEYDEVLPAGPTVRRMARELGVDLRNVRGSGKDGRIMVEDLDPYIEGYIAKRGGVSAAGGVPPIDLPDFSKWGEIRTEKIDGIRRKISEKMTQAWSLVPHVHHNHEVDITDLLALQKRHKARVKEMGGALTITPFILKALVICLREFPNFNATFDSRNGQIIFKEYYHLGVAVDTEGGLIVPVLRDVDKKPIVQLAVELNELADRTRDRKVGLDELRGGTFTLSNLGGIGGGHFNPIINTPEVAILGVGRASKKPMWNGEEFVPRDILPITIGYDHRVIDGADGARFMVRLADVLQNFEATFLGF